MGRKLIDMTGQVFGRLTVMEYIGRQFNSSTWRCQCECGKTSVVQASALKSGSVLSCGCYRKDRMSTLTLSHGERGGENRGNSVEYKAWDGMISRCHNQTDKNWKWYGARGITVCEQWRNDFSAFLRDMGRRPAARMSIDRKDGNGHYEPSNCRWATPIEQARNRSNNRIVEYGGSSMPLSAAAEAAGISYKTVKSRLAKGWTVHESLTRPVDERRRISARNTR